MDKAMKILKRGLNPDAIEKVEIEIPDGVALFSTSHPINKDVGAERARLSRYFHNEAAKIAAEGRPKYGKPEAHFSTVAIFWREYIAARGGIIGMQDVPVMMQLLKIARIATGVPLADNQIDVTGYGNLYQKLMGLETNDATQIGQGDGAGGRAVRQRGKGLVRGVAGRKSGRNKRRHD